MVSLLCDVQLVAVRCGADGVVVARADTSCIHYVPAVEGCNVVDVTGEWPALTQPQFAYSNSTIAAARLPLCCLLNTCCLFLFFVTSTSVLLM